MLTPETKAYIEEQRAAGFSPEIIRDALRSAGWSEKDIAEGLGLPMPEATPAPVVAAPATPAQPTTFETPNRKKSPWPIIVIILLILALIGAGYYIYSNRTKTTPSGAPVTTPTPTAYTNGTNSLGSFTYSYPSTWSAQNIANGTYLSDATSSPTPTPSSSASATPNQLTQIAAASSNSNIIIIGNPYPLSVSSSTPDVQAQGIATQIDASATTSSSIDGFNGYSVINRSTGAAMCEYILEGAANYFTVSFPLVQSCDQVPALYDQIVKNITESTSTPTASPSPSAS